MSTATTAIAYKVPTRRHPVLLFITQQPLGAAGLVVIVLLLGFCVAAGFFAKRLPSSFLPDEDQGYFYVDMQLPKSASMERTVWW